MTQVNELGFLIQHLAFSLVRLNDQVLQERLGLGFSQFKLIAVLERKPHIQQKQIAEALGQTEASISRQIKLLQDKGLLQTTRNPQNRREHITTLTPKGVRFTDEARRILAQYYEPIFSNLSEKQVQQLSQTLQILHEDVCSQTATGSLCRDFINKTVNS